MSVLTVENLRYRYPHTEGFALDGLDFSVEKGEFIGIIGENGAGKSTLSQAVIGLVPQFYKGAYGGKVLVDGLEAAKMPVSEMCRKVGLVFQNPFNQLSGAKDTVYGEVAFGMQNLGVEREEMKRRVEETLRMLDKMIRELASQGRLVLAILHDMDFVAEYFDRVIVMAQGAVLANGDARTVFASQEALDAACLNKPHVTQLCNRLGYPETYLTVEEFLGRQSR